MSQHLLLNLLSQLMMSLTAAQGMPLISTCLQLQEAQRGGRKKCASLANPWALVHRNAVCLVSMIMAVNLRQRHWGASLSIASAAAVDVAPLVDSAG